MSTHHVKAICLIVRKDNLIESEVLEIKGLLRFGKNAD